MVVLYQLTDPLFDIAVSLLENRETEFLKEGYMDQTMLQIVATECDQDCEERFNQWYNDVHVPMLFKYPGLKKVTRYRILGEAEGQPTYLALDEYASPAALEGMQTSEEFKAAMEEMQQSWPSGGFGIKYAVVYEGIKTWER